MTATKPTTVRKTTYKKKEPVTLTFAVNDSKWKVIDTLATLTKYKTVKREVSHPKRKIVEWLLDALFESASDETLERLASDFEFAGNGLTGKRKDSHASGLPVVKAFAKARSEAETAEAKKALQVLSLAELEAEIVRRKASK